MLSTHMLLSFAFDLVFSTQLKQSLLQ